MKNPASAVLYAAPSNPKHPDKKWLQAEVAKLYDKVLRRDATRDEVARMVAFYSTVAAKSSEGAKDWVTLGCFSLASSLENIFY